MSRTTRLTEYHNYIKQAQAAETNAARYANSTDHDERKKHADYVNTGFNARYKAGVVIQFIIRKSMLATYEATLENSPTIQKIAQHAAAIARLKAALSAVKLVEGTDYPDTLRELFMRGVVANLDETPCADVVKIFLSEGISLNTTHSPLTGTLPIMCVQSEAATKILLKFDARLDVTDSNSRTPLMVAAQHDTHDKFILLYNHSTNPAEKRAALHIRLITTLSTELNPDNAHWDNGDTPGFYGIDADKILNSHPAIDFSTELPPPPPRLHRNDDQINEPVWRMVGYKWHNQAQLLSTLIAAKSKLAKAVKEFLTTYIGMQRTVTTYIPFYNPWALADDQKTKTLYEYLPSLFAAQPLELLHFKTTYVQKLLAIDPQWAKGLDWNECLRTAGVDKATYPQITKLYQQVYAKATAPIRMGNARALFLLRRQRVQVHYDYGTTAVAAAKESDTYKSKTSV